MDVVAYYLAMVTLATVPATLVAWLLLHPLAAVWRRIGPVGTYASICAVVIVIMLGMYFVREPLLRVRFGVKLPLAVLAAILLSLSSYINALVYRQVPKSMAFGLEEISARIQGALVTSGIYSRMRHPRFVAMAMAVFAMAMFTNTLAIYILAMAYVPTIFLVAKLEDRELAVRFGRQYEEYAKEVPGFLPRSTKQRNNGESAT